jgi:Uncharacterized conserved protein
MITFTYKGEYITLGQFLKAADVVQSGGEVKDLLMQAVVLVNAEVELRRGRKLRHGDIVRCGHSEWQLVSADTSL